ncbi:MAG: phenylacetate--CoA ligase family protein [Candidatus Scalinduaceae bacterium]
MTNYLRLLATWYRLKTFQYRKIEDIKRYQLKRFKELCQHAYKHIPIYRELYDSYDFNPSSVYVYDDIERVPVITKEIIRSFPLKKKVDSRVTEREVLKEPTSGSTGEPLEVWTGRTESLIQSMKCIRFLREWGYSIFDNTVQISIFDNTVQDERIVSKPKVSLIQKLGLYKRKYISVLYNSDTIVDKLSINRSDVLYSSRSSLEVLADGLEKRGVTINPRILVAGMEIVTEEHRQLFKNIFGCDTLEIYGCIEVGNIAWECPNVSRSHNLHIDMETAVVNFHKIQTREDGSRVGSIIVTNLENYVMPFIRYDLGDQVLFPSNNECTCGRTLQVLGKVLGRNDDVLEYKGRKFNWHFFYNYFKDYSYIKKYKVVQNKNGDIEFRVQLLNDTKEFRRRCLLDLNSAFGKYFSLVKVKFFKVFSLTSGGKFKVIEKM